MKQSMRERFLKFAMILVILCMIGFLFFDDRLLSYLKGLNQTQVETILRFGILGGLLLICGLWLMLGVLMLKHRKWVRNERHLKQEATINQTIQTLNTAISVIRSHPDADKGLEAVKVIEDAIQAHFSTNDNTKALKARLPHVDILIRCLFDHVFGILKHPTNTQRNDVLYCMWYLYTDGRMKAYCMKQHLYPESFEHLYLDQSILNQWLGLKPMKFYHCVFEGDLTVDVASLHRFEFNLCSFMGTFELGSTFNVDVTFEACTFENAFWINGHPKTSQLNRLKLLQCIFKEAVSLSQTKIRDVVIESSVCLHSVTFEALTCHTIVLSQVEIAGGYALKKCHIHELLSLDHVKSQDDIRIVESTFDKTCHISIKHTRIQDEALLWYSLEHG